MNDFNNKIIVYSFTLFYMRIRIKYGALIPTQLFLTFPINYAYFLISTFLL